jgi:membrane protease YdiL (CAAX protease family)
VSQALPAPRRKATIAVIVLAMTLPTSIAVGGAVWAWLYDRSGSLLAPWISHALIDGALFVVGWDMVQ